MKPAIASRRPAFSTKQTRVFRRAALALTMAASFLAIPLGTAPAQAANCDTWLYSTYSAAHCAGTPHVQYRARVECDRGTATNYYVDGPVWYSTRSPRVSYAYCAQGDWAVRDLIQTRSA